MKLSTMRNRAPVIFLIVTLILMISASGCPAIRMIAPYDRKIDEGVTNLQRATAVFFTKIERQGGSKADDYKNHTEFYDDAKVALSGIRVRAEAVSDNSLTTKQLEILSSQFQKLENDHAKLGVPAAAVPQLEKAFNRTFTAILTLEVAKKEPKAQGGGK
jgi:hypothetical protein